MWAVWVSTTSIVRSPCEKPKQLLRLAAAQRSRDSCLHSATHSWWQPHYENLVMKAALLLSQSRMNSWYGHLCLSPRASEVKSMGKVVTSYNWSKAQKTGWKGRGKWPCNIYRFVFYFLNYISLDSFFFFLQNAPHIPMFITIPVLPAPVDCRSCPELDSRTSLPSLPESREVK